MPAEDSPPRAVSRTATSTSDRPRICHAPPGPVQSPGSTSRSSTRTPSDVVVPTRRPARTRMWVIRRVTVLLPFVPVIETTGIFRSASRIQAGGVVRASAIVADQRATARVLGTGQPRAPRRRHSRSVSATAASAIEWARSAPVHGNVTIQWPGSDERWTTRRRGPRRRRPAAAGPSRPTRPTWRRPVLRAGRRPRAGPGVAPGLRWPYQVRRRPIATSILTTGASR